MDMTIDDELPEFFRTLRLPPGRSTRAFLREADHVMNADLPEVGGYHPAVNIATVDGWPLRADIFVPAGHGPFPVLLFLHGGAWTMGSPQTHRRLARDLTCAGLLIVSLDYRRAPKYRFPAAVDDALTALVWIRRHIGVYGGDPAQVAIGGDSAGANIAAGAVTSDDVSDIRAALLLYGTFDYHAVMEELLGPEVDVAHRQSYVDPDRFDELRGDARLSPLLAPRRFPPTLLMAGSDDPTADQSVLMARRLTDAGVENELVVVDGLPHGFFQLPHLPGHAERVRRAAGFVVGRLR